MPEAVQKIRIFISSPGDVQEERDALEALIREDLQQTLGRQQGLYLEPLRWEKLVTPGMGDIQKKVFEEMGPYDIFVGIFWKRFGTPTSAHESGSEAEFRDAYKRWEEDNSRPILMYFCEKPANYDVFSMSPEELAELGHQAQKVKAFREEIAGRGLYATYKELDEFKDKLRQHLYKTIARMAGLDETSTPESEPPAYQVTQNVDGNKGNVIGVQINQETHHHAEKSTHPRSLYLSALGNECRILPLTTIGAGAGAHEQVSLEKVYVSLRARERSPNEDERKVVRSGFSAELIRDVSKVAEKHKRLMLLGDPGSGKSTFVKQLIVQKADDELLPVLITLRDWAPLLRRLDIPTNKKEAQRRLAESLLVQACAEAEGLGIPEFAEGMRHAFLGGKVLMVLDGLDEVPFADRSRVRDAVRAAINRYAFERIIVTCRVRSYGGDAVLDEFATYELMPFDKKQIKQFVSAWYGAQRSLGRLTREKASPLIEDLTKAATKAPLLELAKNPMLLTTMAIVHQEETRLPDERVVLYSKAVDILLRKWQEERGGLPGELAGFLNSDNEVRPALERLAFEAHASRSTDEAADITRARALEILEEDAYLGDSGLAAPFLDYVDQRSGLLIGRGGRGNRPALYSFPHRTFQEYLAGCYLVGLRNPKKMIAEKAEEGEYWSVAVQLGAEELLYNRRSPNQLLDLAGQICPQSRFTEGHDRQSLWSGKMAMTLGVSVIERDEGSGWETGKEYLTRCRNRLVDALSGEMPAQERAEAGRLLSRLGDCREGLMNPDKMSMCFVAVGPFLMGNELQEADVDYDYWIGQSTVTQAQYKAFVDAGGYEEKQWWSEAGWELKEEKEWKNRESMGEPFDLANHPVVGVSWHEALAYTKWLTAKGHEEGWLGKKQLIRLPNEKEWEKAARGGLWIPQEAYTRPLKEIKEPESEKQIDNENAVRKYPWGDDIDVEHCNYEQHIGSTTSSGSFPKGASPYGLEDCAGNVFEWNRVTWGGSEDENSSTSRVVRGGAWWNNVSNARCAYRDDLSPNSRSINVGFRVVLLPFWNDEGSKEAGVK